MYCSKCGRELAEEWNVCPDCGNIINPKAENLHQKVSNTNKIKGRTKFKVLGIIACLIGVCIIIAIFSSPSRGDAVIEYVKQYHDPNAYFCIEECLEMDGGDNIKWSYEKTEPEYVTAEFLAVSGSEIKIVFSVDEYPALYEVYLDGELNQDLFVNYEYALFGIDNRENTVLDILENGFVTDESVSQEFDENVESQISEDADVWFVTYHTFTKEGTEDVLRITAMNDALLYVEFDGADGDWGEWDFNTQYDEIGKDGELIYYYGKDFVMSYYPNEHRIHIETSNDIYQGDFICTNI